MGERAVSVWAWIAAAHDGDAPVSVGALCRAAVLRLGVDGASVTAMSGPVAREPVHASDDVSARLEELQFTTGEGPGTDDFRLGSPMLLAELASVAGRWPGFVPAALAAVPAGGYSGSVTHRQPCCSSWTGRTITASEVSDSSATTWSNWR
jgi:hypothetical protein